MTLHPSALSNLFLACYQSYMKHISSHVVIEPRDSDDNLHYTIRQSELTLSFPHCTLYKHENWKNASCSYFTCVELRFLQPRACIKHLAYFLDARRQNPFAKCYLHNELQSTYIFPARWIDESIQFLADFLFTHLSVLYEIYFNIIIGSLFPYLTRCTDTWVSLFLKSKLLRKKGVATRKKFIFFSSFSFSRWPQYGAIYIFSAIIPIRRTP